MRGVGLQGTKHRVIHPSVGREHREVGADQGEVVIPVHVPDTHDALEAIFIFQTTGQGIGRIRGVGHDPATGDDFHRLLDEPGLGILGMNGKELRHKPSPQNRAGQRQGLGRSTIMTTEHRPPQGKRVPHEKPA